MRPAQVRKIVRSEIKQTKDMHHHTLSLNALTIGTSPQIRKFAVVLQGTGDTQRTGDEIQPQYFQMKGDLYFGTSGTAQDVAVRLILFQWKNHTEATADEPLGTDLIPTSEPYSFYRTDGTMRDVKILWDRTYVGVQSSGNPSVMRPIDVKIPAKKLLPIQYDSSTGVFGSNQIYMAYVGNQTSGVAPVLRHASRLGYHIA